MIKTRLGVSIGLIGSALYFLGLINFLATFILAGYVLMFEKNEWLRLNAKKAVAMVIFFSILSLSLGLFVDLFDIISTIISWITKSKVSFPLSLNSIFSNLISIFKTLLILGMGFSSLRGQTISFSIVDNIINED